MPLTELPFGFPGRVFRSPMPFGPYDLHSEVYDRWCEEQIAVIVLLASDDDMGDVGKYRTRLRSAGRGIIVRGDENERGRRTVDHELLGQLDPGHSTELDIEDETVKPRLLPICDKLLCRRIRDWLKTSRPQQPAKRLAQLFVVIDDGDIDRLGAAHRRSTLGSGAKGRLLPFREGWGRLS